MTLISHSRQRKLTTNKNVPVSPLKLYRQVYCRNCQNAEFCNVSFEQRLLCILAKLADDIARIRQGVSVNENR